MAESHIAFFSYARENLDPALEGFFKDLSLAIQPATPWPQYDERIIFRDKDSLRLAEKWKSHIEGALQTSAVLVCITSPAYFSKEFCGKEYYFFDQRRRQGLAPGQDPPPVILPIIWYPVKGNPIVGDLPEYVKDIQLVPKGLPDSYLDLGLLKLKKNQRRLYGKCVDAFAEMILAAWQQYRNLPRLQNVQDFSDIPSVFEGGDWQEAAGSGGWLPGPEVANFVFVAESSEEMPEPLGRYGKWASDWRPYHPPERMTILDQAKNAAKKQFKFREIRVDQDLANELVAAKKRKNLSVIIGDPKALPLESFKPVRDLENVWWDGTAMLLPCDDSVVRWDDVKLQSALREAFPTLYPALVRGPLRSPAELQAALDLVLTDMRAAVTRPEIEKRAKVDEPPPGVVPGVAPEGTGQ